MYIYRVRYVCHISIHIEAGVLDLAKHTSFSCLQRRLAYRYSQAALGSRYYPLAARKSPYAQFFIRAGKPDLELIRAAICSGQAPPANLLVEAEDNLLLKYLLIEATLLATWGDKALP